MTVKLALLKSGESVISNIKEIFSKDPLNPKLQGYLFENPHKVITQQPILLTEEVYSNNDSIQVSLSSWIMLSSDSEIVVVPDWVVAIVEPIKSLKSLYEEKINDQTSKMFTSEN
jgi:hypothetical protein